MNSRDLKVDVMEAGKMGQHEDLSDFCLWAFCDEKTSQTGQGVFKIAGLVECSWYAVV